jgi:hypothetical protein
MIDFRQMSGLEFHVHHGTDDLDDFADLLCGCGTCGHISYRRSAEASRSIYLRLAEEEPSRFLVAVL